MLEQIMDNFYLSEKEAKVYLANLELHRSRASAIAKKSGLNRVTAYEILKRLVRMGIAHSTTYGNVQTFQVIEPRVLIQKMESRLRVAKDILPQLTLLSGTKKIRPKISFYEGSEGVRTVYEDTLSCREKKIYNIANPEPLLGVIGESFFKQYVKKRVSKKIYVYVLMPDNQAGRLLKKEAKETLRDAKLFDTTQYTFPNEILIYDNKVALLSFSTLIGVIVEDVDIATSFKTFWQMAWNSLN